MPDAPSQSSETPTALDLLQKFLDLHKIRIQVLPLKTWYDSHGRYVIDPPKVSVEYVKEEPVNPKKKSK